MSLKVTNNAFGTLNAGISNSDVTIVLEAGQGARFPVLGAGDYFYATLIDTSNNLEIVKVTARATDTMTVVRAQDGTTARAYNVNDRFELRPTAALFNEKADAADVDAGFVSKTSATGAALMPVGTTAQRPASPAAGMYRLNSTTGEPEWYDTVSGVWVAFRSAANYAVEYLVVAAGGGGGGYGGGGAGGYRTGTSDVLTAGQSYTVTVGAGGAGGNLGNNGGNSVFSNITSLGGGGGAGDNNNNGAAGGSGGGGNRNLSGATSGGAGTSGQGNNGGGSSLGSLGGGGGGAGAAGANATTAQAGAGGSGSASSINGTSVTRAGGGGAGANRSGTPSFQAGAGGSGGGGAGGVRDDATVVVAATAGSVNTGGGGGGDGVGNGAGAAGGSGVVIIRYLGGQRGTGGTVTSAGGFTIHTFTSSGTFTA
jgi:hypothetical protein